MQFSISYQIKNICLCCVCMEQQNTFLNSCLRLRPSECITTLYELDNPHEYCSCIAKGILGTVPMELFW